MRHVYEFDWTMLIFIFKNTPDCCFLRNFCQNNSVLVKLTPSGQTGVFSASCSQSTRSALAAASDIHRQVPTNMADIRRDWLTNQNTDCCFVVIGLVGIQSDSPLLQVKIDPAPRIGLPSLLSPSGCQRILINIRGQYGIQKNIYIHPWLTQSMNKSQHIFI